MDRETLDALKTELEGLRYFLDESMQKHTSFKIGGNADVFVYAEEEDEILRVFELAKMQGIPLNVIGNGSNLLVADAGVEGIVLAIKSENKDYEPDPVKKEDDGSVILRVPAGTRLSAFSRAAARLGFKGTEPLAGIPGSVGGAVAMNAGAYGGEIKDIIVSARTIDRNGELRELEKEELELSYRSSAVLKKGLTVSSALFRLEKGNAEESLALIGELNGRRRDKQPLEYPSAGSAFKRPEGHFAGQLIEEAGLKGFSIGGAMVSEKHSGFIINTGGASAEDVKNLLDEVGRIVYEKSGVRLEPEIRMLGRF